MLFRVLILFVCVCLASSIAAAATLPIEVSVVGSPIEFSPRSVNSFIVKVTNIGQKRISFLSRGLSWVCWSAKGGHDRCVGWGGTSSGIICTSATNYDPVTEKISCTTRCYDSGDFVTLNPGESHGFYIKVDPVKGMARAKGKATLSFLFESKIDYEDPNASRIRNTMEKEFVIAIARK